jgi:3',5'-cyclic AMP phosphodiesterase CpdA
LDGGDEKFMTKKIIHLSDVHFGDSTFENGLKNNLLEQLEEKPPDIIVVAGDLTSNGYFEEHEKTYITNCPKMDNSGQKMDNSGIVHNCRANV